MKAENFYDALKELDRTGDFQSWVMREYTSCYDLYSVTSDGVGEIYYWRINALFTHYAILRSDLYDIIESEYGEVSLPENPSDIPSYVVNTALEIVARRLYQERLDTLRELLDLTDGLGLFHLDEVYNDLSERDKDLIIDHCEGDPDTLEDMLKCDTITGLMVDKLADLIKLNDLI